MAQKAMADIQAVATADFRPFLAVWIRIAAATKGTAMTTSGRIAVTEDIAIGSAMMKDIPGSSPGGAQMAIEATLTRVHSKAG